MSSFTFDSPHYCIYLLISIIILIIFVSSPSKLLLLGRCSGKMHDYYHHSHKQYEGMQRRGKTDSQLTESRYEGVQKQTDNSQRERHCGYRSPQRSLLFPDLHHHSTTRCRGSSHSFGPEIFPCLNMPLLCSSFFLCHHSSFLLLSLFYQQRLKLAGDFISVKTRTVPLDDEDY